MKANRTINLIVVFTTFSLFVACSNSNKEDFNYTSKNASNLGQASVVDEVSKKNILQIAIGSSDHSTLVAAVQAAKLENVLVNAGPLTVFAPINKAFEDLPEGVLDDLLKTENKSKLAKIVTGHAAPGKFTFEMLKQGLKLYMATGHHAVIEIKDGVTYIHGSRLLGTVEASNGIVHVVDKVILY